MNSNYLKPNGLKDRIKKAHAQLTGWRRVVEAYVPADRLAAEQDYHYFKPWAENAMLFSNWAMSLSDILKANCIDMPKITGVGAARNPVCTLVIRPGLECAPGYVETPAVQSGCNDRHVTAPVQIFGDAITRLEYALADSLTLCIVVNAKCNYDNSLDCNVLTIPVWEVNSGVMEFPRPLVYLRDVSFTVEATTCTAQAEKMTLVKVVQHTLSFQKQLEKGIAFPSQI